MGNKRLGRILFLIADFSDESQYFIKLINQLANLIPNSIVVVNDENLPVAQNSFSSKVKLYNISMRESNEGKKVIHAMFCVIRPDLVLVFSSDKKAKSFSEYSKLAVKTLFVGETLTVSDDAIEAIGDEPKTASYIVKYVEKEKNIDCYPKYYAHKKSLNAQMRLREIIKAFFLREERVQNAFLAEWGYNLPKLPHTYNEKLNWLKIFGNYHRYRRYADKFKVRKFLRKRGYGELLPKCYAVVDSHITERIWNRLPDRFVIKPSNSSGYNITIDDKSLVDMNVINRVLSCIKKVRYGCIKNEPVYPFCGKFVLTEFIDNLTDYKFFCFDGKVGFVAIVKEWLKENDSNEPYQIIVDRDYKELPFSYGYERGTASYKKPIYYDDMLKVVENLSKGLAHVRLDLMGDDARFFFGEFTFFPGGGKDRFTPSEYDAVIGQLLDLSTMK